MAVYKNNEFIKVGDEENITVSVTFTRPRGTDDYLSLRNAIEALRMFANTGENQSWVKKIEVK